MIFSKNKKAFYDYTIIEAYEAGISLTGAEVKAIREGKCNLLGSFVSINNKGAFLKQAHISKPSLFKEEFSETKDRQLLLRKKQIKELYKNSKEQGYSIVPLKVYQKENTGLIKVEIALVKGKNTRDKRLAIKERELKREINNSNKKKVLF